jgi:hypothetical protein
MNNSYLCHVLEKLQKFLTGLSNGSTYKFSRMSNSTQTIIVM